MKIYCKVYLTLSALIICHANASYEYERLKAELEHSAAISRVPWNSDYDVYEVASSETLPRYYDSYGSSGYRRISGDSLEDPSRFSISDRVAKQENRGEPRGSRKTILKKTIFPLYSSFRNKDSAKYEGFTPNTESAYCREIKKFKSIGKEGEDPKRKGVATTCYKCKDPKTKSTYERCVYNASRPEEIGASAGTKSERSSPREPFASSRYRRSNSDKDADDYGKPRNPYRFADEYFTDATHEVPDAAYESKGERCDKIVKNSMVCIVCEDPKTNGKYEQCSYVKGPREKTAAYPYTESSSLGYQRREGRKNENDGIYGRRPEEGSYSEASDIRSESGPRRDRTEPIAVEKSREYSYPGEFYYPDGSPSRATVTEREYEVQESPSADCEQVQKGSKICTVCKDPKVGGAYERCSYNYQPGEKLYKYSRSESFGYPDSKRDSGKVGIETTESESKRNPDSARLDHDYFDRVQTDGSELFAYPPSRSTGRLAEAEVESDFDSATTSYASPSDYSSGYSPNPEGSNDREFSPSNHDSRSHRRREEEGETDRRAATPYPGHAKSAASAHRADDGSKKANNCKEVRKDSMTCTICKDPKTGSDFEQCSYSYRPADKIFSYSKSSSYGDSAKENKDEKPRSGDGSAEDSYQERDPPDEREEASRRNEEVRGRPENEQEGKTTEGHPEIAGFLRDFRQQDRSRCKKITRDKMTCYRCVDEEGSRKEECVFVGAEEPDKDRIAFRESKEYQIADPDRSGLELPSATKTTATTAAKPGAPLEPNVSASKNSYVRLEKPADNDYPDDEASAPAAGAIEETEIKEAEPYDYTSETRSKYDKVLGLTLPAYMFTVSEHEAAFDEVVDSSRDRR